MEFIDKLDEMGIAQPMVKIVKHLIHRIKIRLGLYDLRKEGAKWVAKNIGEDYVEEFLAKYDDINRGIPIGGPAETIAFLDIIKQIKKDIKNEKC